MGTTSQQNAGIFKVRTAGTCSSRCASNGQYFLGICKKILELTTLADNSNYVK
jgi:hypothetical protein